MAKEAAALPRKEETRLQMEQKIAKERRKMTDNLKGLRLERHHLEGVLNRLRLLRLPVAGMPAENGESPGPRPVRHQVSQPEAPATRNGGPVPMPPAVTPERLMELEEVWDQARKRLRRWNPRPAWPPAGC